MEQYILAITYLVASVLFIFGLKMLGDPKTARNGNLLAALGMGLAILATMAFHKNDAGERIGNYGWIIGGLVVGTIAGWIRSEEHTYELQSLMRNSYAVFCLKKKKQ